MSNYLLLFCEYRPNSETADNVVEEGFNTQKAAYARMMDMYRTLAIEGNPDKIANADFGEHWATVNYTDGSKATIEILEKV